MISQGATRRPPTFDRGLYQEREYWRERLSGRQSRSSLICDFAPSEAHGERRGELRWQIDGDLYRRLQRLTNGGSFLSYTTLMTALSVSLQPHLRTSQVCVGSPARLVGDHVNALAICSNIEPHASFQQLLLAMRSTLLDAYSHQLIPYEQVLDALGARLGDRPFFELTVRLEGLHSELPEVGAAIEIDLEEETDHIDGRARFDRGLYRESTIGDLVASWQEVLNAGLTAPTAELRRLDLIGARARQRLSSWASDSVTEPPQESFPARFEARVEQCPDAPAVVTEDELISYSELDRRANQLAHELIRRGVGPESLVGISMTRGATSAVLAILGVLKAGGAFLPLDPEYPWHRLAFMVADSGLRLVLTDSHTSPAFASSGVETLDLDREWALVARHRPRRPPGELKHGQAAYVIYTSGTTGRPKGALLTHGGLVNLAEAQSRAFQVESDSRVLQFASMSFDAAVSEIVMALVVGAALHLGSRDQLLPGAKLTTTLRERRITHATIPPSSLELLRAADVPDLAVLIVAGEVCAPRLAAEWSRNRMFLDAYGPTETTVCATIAYQPDHDARLSIGRPMENVRVYLCDPQTSLVAPGAPGEIYVGGICLARGYVGRPATTAEAFVPDPHSGELGGRLYRTGDLARLRADGELDFLGRIDHQVKIRGYRIEPAEIETALVDQSGVVQAVVAPRDLPSGEPALVGYFVPEPGKEVATASLREALALRLPQYMVPAAFVALEHLPKTPSGKIDREALPAPDWSERAATTVPPRSNIEVILAGIWEEVLERSQISVHDSFFDLGGTSLAAVRMMAIVKEVLGVDLPLTELFQATTIEQLALLIQAKRGTRHWSPMVTIRGRGTAEPLYCVHPGGGNVVCYWQLASHLNGDRPIFALEARGLAHGQEPQESLEAMADLYIEAIRARRPRGPYALLGWSFGGVAAFEMARKLEAAGEQISFLGMLDSYSPWVVDSPSHRQDDSDVLVALVGGVLEVGARELRQLGEEERLHYVIEEAKKKDVIPPSFDVDKARRMLRVAKNNFAAVERYRPPSYGGRIHLYRAEEERDFATTITDLEDLGWAELCRGLVTRFVGGNHQTMTQVPHVDQLAASLEADLDAAVSEAS
ncbi:MAG: amino acid adenylation domain-containing protein [Thermoanaerobaculia bacterium]|nr:amino acid adenylation domain-containing protein [Thermoanaerobaculia bacterium]